MGENKMLLPLCGKTVLRRSFDALIQSGLIDRMVLVASQETRAVCDTLAKEAPIPCTVTMGGAERQDSVINGLRMLNGVDYAVIHDGARCLVTKELIAATLQSAKELGSGVAAVPSTDTVKRAQPDGLVEETLDRR